MILFDFFAKFRLEVDWLGAEIMQPKILDLVLKPELWCFGVSKSLLMLLKLQWGLKYVIILCCRFMVNRKFVCMCVIYFMMF